MSETILRERIAQQRAGHALSSDFYTDEHVYRAELRGLLMGSWVLAGHVSELAAPGSRLVVDIGDASMIVTRAADGALHALHNVCRHRGMRLCDGPGAAPSITCRYHSWSYALDGKLLVAHGTPEGFDQELFGLKRGGCRVLHGLVFVRPHGDDASFDDIAKSVGEALAPRGLERTRVVGRRTWTAAANWKLVVENFDECYHCWPNHPQYCDVMLHARKEASATASSLKELDDLLAEWRRTAQAAGVSTRTEAPRPDRDFWFARLPFKTGCETQSPSGKLIAPLLGSATRSDGAVTSVRICPVSHVLANPDYAVLFQMLPRGAESTSIVASWLVRDDAIAGADVDVEALRSLWTATTDQDVALVEAQQRGVRSSGYEPGPFVDVEEFSALFVAWYLRKLGGGT